MAPWLQRALFGAPNGRADPRQDLLEALGEPAIGPLVALAGVGIMAIAAVGRFEDELFARMVWANLALLAAALWVWRGSLRTLVFGSKTQRRSTVAAGATALAFVVGLYGASLLVVVAASHEPEWAAEVSELYALTGNRPLAAAVPMLVFVVAVEELCWRGIALAATPRLGPVGAIVFSAMAFCLAHISAGPPLLWLAAFGAGAVWAWLAVRSRRLWPAFVSHLAWDVVVLWVLPLGDVAEALAW